jgi:hypothetical protein
MHVTGLWAAAGAIITGLIVADVLAHWQGSSSLLRIGGRTVTKESGLLAGK